MRLRCLLFFLLAAMPAAKPAKTAVAGQRSLSLRLDIEPPEPGHYRNLHATATIANHGTTTVTLVRPGDGSLEGWRTPVVTWRIVDSKGTAQFLADVRCGNMNSLDASEVVDVPPGGTLSVTEWIDPPTLALPGRYQASIEYRNDPNMGMSGVLLGAPDPIALARVRASLAVTLESNIVDVDL